MRYTTNIIFVIVLLMAFSHAQNGKDGKGKEKNSKNGNGNGKNEAGNDKNGTGTTVPTTTLIPRYIGKMPENLLEEYMRRIQMFALLGDRYKVNKVDNYNKMMSKYLEEVFGDPHPNT